MRPKTSYETISLQQADYICLMKFHPNIKWGKRMHVQGTENPTDNLRG